MLGKRLQQLRNKFELTQEELAKILCMSRSTYAQYEVDRRKPDYDTLHRIADYFKVSIDFLLGRTEYSIIEECCLPSRLKMIRELNDISLEQLAEGLNLSLNDISQFETGEKYPTPSTLKVLAECLNCSVDFLLGRITEPRPYLFESQQGYSTLDAYGSDDPLQDLPEEAKKSLAEFKEFILNKYRKEN
ncbi:helix-turn-helix domain-containing protein [Desulfosporosinus meridiei]|uniref:Putative transcriptional regulator n=1 Tax=Desulfosporosinus meridiei (strain ATCC BAA-275 / DSM 13257 / KCTC 12902 / NCIMB 13706 / S10) TaxID=768704 RepID=J7J245_DESMD|nr:helix-turn-helix transcriptional regulator [Desulfosporosinus meridiei]AFQ45358.1 putative transcriptional regulator [Desulfosporosinus meridiei DSM 13257]